MDSAVQGLASANAAAEQSPLRWLLLGGLLATLVWTAAVLSLRWSSKRWQRLQVSGRWHRCRQWRQAA